MCSYSTFLLLATVRRSTKSEKSNLVFVLSCVKWITIDFCLEIAKLIQLTMEIVNIYVTESTMKSRQIASQKPIIHAYLKVPGCKQWLLDL